MAPFSLKAGPPRRRRPVASRSHPPTPASVVSRVTLLCSPALQVEVPPEASSSRPGTPWTTRTPGAISMFKSEAATSGTSGANSASPQAPVSRVPGAPSLFAVVEASHLETSASRRHRHHWIPRQVVASPLPRVPPSLRPQGASSGRRGRRRLGRRSPAVSVSPLDPPAWAASVAPSGPWLGMPRKHLLVAVHTSPPGMPNQGSVGTFLLVLAGPPVMTLRLPPTSP